MYLLYIFPRAPHTYNFVVLTSLTHPRKIILVVLQIQKAKDLSTPYVYHEAKIYTAFLNIYI
jgi:hypothetical protein